MSRTRGDQYSSPTPPGTMLELLDSPELESATESLPPHLPPRDTAERPELETAPEALPAHLPLAAGSPMEETNNAQGNRHLQEPNLSSPRYPRRGRSAPDRFCTYVRF